MNFRRSEPAERKFSFLLLLWVVVSTDGWAQDPGRVVRPERRSPSDWTQPAPIGPRLAILDVGGKDLPALPVDVLVEKMLAASARRATALRGFRETRLYNLEYHGLFGARQATMRVLASFAAPEQRNFTVIAQSGSKLLLNRVLLRLLDSEREAYRNERQIELTPENYRFQSGGLDRDSNHNPCYILNVEPRQESRFLYRGKIWVDAQDFALARMEGQPAKSPSFWIRDTQIDSTWQKTAGFWFIRH
ncbi:MAG: hypothetical protein JO356_16060, partial [Acidobacteria bacterium]|nr:hypothetical protein [Acidobacteriota bacterium]